MMKNSLLLLFIFSSLSTFAGEITYLARSPRALLMGDAYTALANDDEYTLFYNPAALGLNQSVSITPLNPNIGLTNALDELDRFENFPSSDTAAIADRLLGFPVYLHLDGIPTIKMPFFAISLFASSTTSLVLRNAVHPALNVKYSLDKGFATGFAFSFGKGAKRKKGSKIVSTGHRTSVGLGVKFIKREGLDSEFDLFSTDILNTVSNGVENVSDLREALGYAKGKGWGFDLGIDHAISTGMTEYHLAASILDVADTKFRKIGVSDESVPRQDMAINLGASAKQNFKLIEWSLALDFHSINQPVDYRRMIGVGGSFRIFNVEFLAGFNQGYPSYGVSLNLWPIKLTAGFYGVELGEKYREEKGSRAILQLSLLDIELDL
ncbi:hypothetical protein M899_2653 [Bacteriovorax sp. BSW11_IV]|uniref:hypothetical protein n=1 Tax=Bacteriovorax sp. BSW11_IV TaxID=1353529 RepID=UPI00038A0179|nr:hypothetical protein [Bacteriovorax sp. BSW11_IV]EQC48141.1 hypothetical protein M899_2653 [Bacteriovorax sp. BSW11_IV]